MKTHLPKVNLDLRKWHVIDADGAVLGRLAVQVANILRGKNKPVYTPHLDAGDFVVVINAEKVVVTGKKETKKEFMTYSGWKGGEKYTSVAQVRARQPEKLITHAVRGMVPKNRLGRVLMTKLKVYKGDKHPHSAQHEGGKPGSGAHCDANRQVGAAPTGVDHHEVGQPRCRDLPVAGGERRTAHPLSQDFGSTSSTPAFLPVLADANLPNLR